MRAANQEEGEDTWVGFWFWFVAFVTTSKLAVHGVLSC